MTEISRPQKLTEERPFGLGEWAAYVALCAIWGTTWMAIRVVVQDVPPLRAAGVRFLVGAALLLGGVALRRSIGLRSAREWRAVRVLSFSMMAVPYGLLFWAEQHITSSMAAVLYTSLPLVVALLTPLMSHHRVPRSALLAMLVAMGGIAVLFQSTLAVSSRSLLGGVAVLGAVGATAWSVHFAKKELHDIDPSVATGWQLLGGAAVLLALSLPLERRPSHWTPEAVGALLFLAVGGSAVAFALYYWLLKRTQPYQISTMSMVIPIVAIVEGAALLKEPIPPTMLAASLVVILAVGAVLRAREDEDRLQSGIV
jgi:drug/metabolite transporter (DMT)-like permease